MEIVSPLTDIWILSQELCLGVFLAGVFTKNKNGKAKIKILNTRDEEVILKNLRPQVHAPSYYNILNFEKIVSNDVRKEKVLSCIDKVNLNCEDLSVLEKLIQKYSDIFHLEDDSLSSTNLTQLKINLKSGAAPKFVKPYRLPHSQKFEIQRQVEKMINDDLIEPSVSPWNALLLLVPKKSNTVDPKFRLVIDYRQT